MRSSQRGQKKIFISHSARDRAFVLRLTRVLGQHCVAYWYSAKHIRGAQEWHDEIGRALHECNWFLVVLTPASLRSLWLKRELAFALRQRRYNERIIPVLLKRCQFQDLSWTLGQFEFVDFTGDFEVACQQLLRIWGIEYEPEFAGAQSTNKKKKKAH
jgi:TIR domain-containing protein